MNILIDVDQLQAEGVLTPELATRLRAAAKRQTGAAALNALLAFGAFAVAIGACILAQSAVLAAALGLTLFIGGAAMRGAAWTNSPASASSRAR